MAHRVRSSFHSSAVSDCSDPPHCSPLRAHGYYRRMHTQRSPCITQHTAQHTSNTHTDFQPRARRYEEGQALQAKWRNLPSLRASCVSLLTCRVGGMLIRLSCVRVLHVFSAPSPFSSFCHRPSTRVRCWLQREIPRGTERNRRVSLFAFGTQTACTWRSTDDEPICIYSPILQSPCVMLLSRCCSSSPTLSAVAATIIINATFNSLRLQRCAALTLVLCNGIVCLALSVSQSYLDRSGGRILSMSNDSHSGANASPPPTPSKTAGKHRSANKQRGEGNGHNVATGAAAASSASSAATAAAASRPLQASERPSWQMRRTPAHSESDPGDGKQLPARLSTGAERWLCHG